MRLTIPDLQPGKGYFVEFQGKNDLTESEWSRKFTFTTTAYVVVPKTPATPSWVVAGDSFHGEWAPVTTNTNNQIVPVVRYELELTANGVSRYISVTPQTSSGAAVTYDLSFENNRAIFGTPKPTVAIRVRAVDNLDNKSDWSPSVSATNPVPAPPTAPVVGEGVDTISLRWTPPADNDIVSYVVHVGGTAGFTPDSSNRIYSGDTTQFSYTTTTYSLQYFKIAAVDKFGQTSTYLSAQGTPVSPFTVDTTPPSVPTAVSVATGYDAARKEAYVDVNWTAPVETDVARYVIRYGPSATGPWTYENADKTATSARLYVTAGTLQHVSIRAQDWSGNQSAYVSATGSPITAGSDTLVPKQVLNVVATPVGTSFTVTWDAVTQNADNSAIVDLKEYAIGVKNGSTEVFYRQTGTRFDFTLEMNRAAFGTPKAAVTFRVAAVDAGNLGGAWSANALATQSAPNAPTALTNALGANSITIGWTGSTSPSVLSYNVYQGTSASPTGLAAKVDGTIFTATVGTVAQYFSVKALDVFGQESTALNGGPFTAPNPYTVDTNAPAAPASATTTTGYDATRKQAYIDAAWAAVGDSDLARYVVRYGPSTTGPWTYVTTDKDVTSTRVYVTPGITYYVGVRSEDFVSNKSVFTNSSTYPVTSGADTTAPATVTGLAVASVSTSFRATWNANTDNDLSDYEVGITYSGGTEVFYRTSATRFDLTLEANRAAFGGTPRPIIQVRVRAYDVGGLAGTWSTPVTGTNNPPPTPTLPTSVTGANSITIGWTAPNSDDLRSYNVYQGTTASPTTLVSNTDSTAFTTTVGTVAQYFTVKAVDNFGQEGSGLDFGPITAPNPYVIDSTAPAVPAISAATLTNVATSRSSNLAVTWGAVADSDLQGYVIRYLQSGASTWTELTASKDATSVLIQGLVPYVAYSAQIRAFDYNGNYSAWSASTNATAPANNAPTTPTGLAATASKDNISYSWAPLADTDIKNYEVTFATNAGFTTGVTTFLNGVSTSLTVSGLAPGTTYYARVRATDEAGQSSAFSTTVSATTVAYGNYTSDGVVPPIPAAPTVTGEIGSLAVAWTPVTNNDPVTYEVHLSAVTGFNPIPATKCGEVTGSFFVIQTLPGTTTGLTYGTTYYVKLVAKDKDGSSNPSPQGSGVPLRVTSTDLSVSIGGGNLAWNGAFADVANLPAGINGASTATNTTTTYNGGRSLAVTLGTSNASGTNMNAILPRVVFKPNTKYSLSIWTYNPSVGGTVSLQASAQGNVAANAFSTPITVTDAWMKHTVTFTTNANPGTGVQMYILGPVGTAGQVVYVGAWQVEEGDMPTAWSLNVQEAKAAADAAQLTASNTGGARNLFTKSRTMTPFSSYYQWIGTAGTQAIVSTPGPVWSSAPGSPGYANVNAIRFTTASGVTAQLRVRELREPGYHTLSFWYKRAGATDSAFTVDIRDSTSLPLTATSTWQKAVLTQNVVGVDGTYNFVDFNFNVNNDIFIYQPMLEVGMTASAYTPSPEELEADTLAAQTTANTANTTANSANATAIAAQAAQFLNSNQTFADWTGVTPVGYQTHVTDPTKETTIVKTAPNAARWNIAANVGAGLQCGSLNVGLNGASDAEYFTYEVDIYLVSGDLQGAGVLIDWNGYNAGQIRVNDNLAAAVPIYTTGKWFRVTRTVKRPTVTSGTFTRMGAYLMANYTAWGAQNAKDIIFDRFGIRQATASEILAYESKGYTDTTVATSASGKNKVTYSTATPVNGSTAGIVGDTWFVRDGVTGQITAMYECTATNTWVTRPIADTAIANLNVGKLLSGSITAADIQVAGTGQIRSTDYVAGTSGWKIANAGGLEINQGAIRARALNISMGGENEITNSSFENGVVGFSSNSANNTIGTSTAQKIRGNQSGVVTVTTVGSSLGIQRPVTGLIPNTKYTFSLWYYNPTTNGVPGVQAYTFDGTTYAGVVGTVKDAWTRLSYTLTTPATGNIIVYALINGTPSVGNLFYTDGWMLEVGDVATAYSPRTDEILPGTISATMMQANSITASNGAIENLAVTSAKIADAAITTAKIGDAQITNAKIGDAQITTAKIGDAEITGAKIKDATITTALIGDAQITSAKIDTLTATKIVAGTYTGGVFEVATGGFIQSTNYTGTTGFRLSASGLELRSGTVSASTLEANSTITNNLNVTGTLTVSAAGSIQSSNYTSTTGYRVVSNGIELNDANSKVSAAALQGGTISASSAIVLGPNANLIVNGGYLKSNTNTGTSIATAEASGTGFYLDANGLFIGGNSRIRANALISDTLTATTITLGTNGFLQSNNFVTGSSGWQLGPNGLEIVNGIIRASAIQLTTGGFNLVKNSSFSSSAAINTNFSSNGSATIAYDSAENFYGFPAQAAKATSTGAANTGIFQTIPAADLKPNTQYFFTAYVKLPATNSVSQVNTTVQGTGITNITSISTAIPTSANVAGAGWVRIGSRFTTGATVANAIVFVYSPTTPAAGLYFHTDAWQVEEGDFVSVYSPRGDEILPGTVSGSALIANTVNANVLQANTAINQNLNVTSSLTLGTAASASSGNIRSFAYTSGSVGWNINYDGNAEFNNVTVRGNLQGNSSSVISGGTFTGGVFQTNATNNSVIRINTSGISARRADGTQVFLIDGTTGDQTIGGNSTITGTTSLGGTLTVAGGISVTGAAGTAYIRGGGFAGATSSGASGTGYILDVNGLYIGPGSTVSAAALSIGSNTNLLGAIWAGAEATGHQNVNVATIAFDTTNVYQGTRALRVSYSGTAGTARGFGFTNANLTEAVPVEQGKTYFISFWARNNTTTPTVGAFGYVSQNNTYTSAGNVQSVVTIPSSVSGWTRMYATFTPPVGTTSIRPYFTSSDASFDYNADAFQIEEKFGLNAPGTWVAPGLTSIDGAMIKTGSIASSATTVVNGSTTPLWSISTTGGATFAAANILGNTVIGANTSDTTSFIRSSNWTSASTGWMIRADGTAEFNGNLAIRGNSTFAGTITSTATITGSTINGGIVQTSATANTGIKITSAGFNAYNGTSSVFSVDGATGNTVIGGTTTLSGTTTVTSGSLVINGGALYGGGNSGAASGNGFFMNNSGLFIGNGTIKAAALELQVAQNVMTPPYADFEYADSYYGGKVLVSSGSVYSLDTATKWNNTKSLKVTFGATTPYLYFGTSTSDTNGFNIEPSVVKSYIVSFWYNAPAGANINMNAKFRQRTASSFIDSAAGTMIDVITGTTGLVADGTWRRARATVVTSGTNTGMACLLWDSVTPSRTIYLDGIQVEEKMGRNDTPSTWTPPGGTMIDGGSIVTGSITSNNTLSTGAPSWSIAMTGAATFSAMNILGNTILGNSPSDSTSQIASSNFTPGVKGWRIAATGDAEFNGAIIRGNTVLGSAGDGASSYIQSYGYTSTSGWKIDAAGSATFNDATIRGTFATGTSGGIQIKQVVVANPFESGTAWALTEYSLGQALWSPGYTWAQYAASNSGFAGNPATGALKIVSPFYNNATSGAAAVELIGLNTGKTYAKLSGTTVELVSQTMKLTSADGSGFDINVNNTNVLQFLNAGGERIVFDYSGLGRNVIRSADSNANFKRLDIVGTDIFMASQYVSGSTNYLTFSGDGGRPNLISAGMNLSLLYTVNGLAVTQWSNSATFQPIRASAFTVASDQKFKNNIEPVTGALALVKKIKVYDYDQATTDGGQHRVDSWIEDENRDSPRSRGILAHELEKVAPDFVVNNDSGDEETKMVDMYPLLSTALAAIKELSETVDSLKKEINVLKKNL